MAVLFHVLTSRVYSFPNDMIAFREIDEIALVIGEFCQLFMFKLTTKRLYGELQNSVRGSRAWDCL